MKVLYLIFLIPLCQGLRQCSTPKDMRVATNGDGDDLWLDINWSKVENIDDADPILGYKSIAMCGWMKNLLPHEFDESACDHGQCNLVEMSANSVVKMWVVKPQVTYKYEPSAEGKLKASPKEELPQLDINEEPGDNLTELIIPANKTEAIIKGLKKGITYEVGVHAYSEKCEGSLTKKMRIKLNPIN